MLAIRSSQEI